MKANVYDIGVHGHLGLHTHSAICDSSLFIRRRWFARWSLLQNMPALPSPNRPYPEDVATLSKPKMTTAAPEQIEYFFDPMQIYFLFEQFPQQERHGENNSRNSENVTNKGEDGAVAVRETDSLSPTTESCSPRRTNHYPNWPMIAQPHKPQTLKPETPKPRRLRNSTRALNYEWESRNLYDQHAGTNKP